MISIIKSVPDYTSKSPQEIYDFLNADVVVKNYRGWTPKDILEEGRLTKDELRILVGTMQADPLTWLAAQWFATSKEGLEFGSDERQAFVQDLSDGGNWEAQIAGMTGRVKALGFNIAKNWQQLGGSGEVPSANAIEKAMAIAQCRDDMAAILQPVQAKSTAVNAWLDSLDTSTMTVAEVQTYCAVLLASEDGNPQ